MFRETTMHKPIAYMPLSTYIEAVSDAAIVDAMHYGAGLGLGLHVAAFAADLPQPYSPMGDVAFDLSGWIEEAKKACANEAKRLQAVVTGAGLGAEFAYHAHMGALMQTAPAEARRFDLSLLPWQKDAVTMRELAEAVIFGAGRPALLVPKGTKPAPLEHLAIAWDGSAVAARALNDALPLLVSGGQILVLCAASAGATPAQERADAMASALKARGYAATGVAVPDGAASLSATLQDVAKARGAGLLAMGGFGHSRLRDFVLGGATKGVLGQLTIPVLLSH
jgi:nucleotide-binding universal stress UspA family protein